MSVALIGDDKDKKRAESEKTRVNAEVIGVSDDKDETLNAINNKVKAGETYFNAIIAWSTEISDDAVGSTMNAVTTLRATASTLLPSRYEVTLVTVSSTPSTPM
ncbi:hypothetical protein Tdes44962_MAKER07226 [Teratosphaeria destructans]|uniref:Uncharacterized protein n=1 Tax=Teratosphaeria destructans TaxID=418781 RepID=A0A9W7W644_9PEZI|nr:hypothetical protein Tdes44962_MAKER07226 [Teratosphaeria destructans]